MSVPSESLADAVISADAPLATFSARVFSSVSVSVGGVTSYSSTSVKAIVNSLVLVLESLEVEVTKTRHAVTVS